MGLKVQMGDITKLRLKLQGIRERMSDLTPVLEGQAEALQTMMERSFTKQTSPQGKPWATLSAATLGKRRKGGRTSKHKTTGKKRGVKALLDTRTLFENVKAEGEKNAIAFGITDETPTGGRYGTATYGYVHQFGTNKAGINRNITIPARPFMPTTPDGTPFFDSGPAKRWFDRMHNAVRAYILRGTLKGASGSKSGGPL